MTGDYIYSTEGTVSSCLAARSWAHINIMIVLIVFSLVWEEERFGRRVKTGGKINSFKIHNLVQSQYLYLVLHVLNIRLNLTRPWLQIH